ncbi:MAG TPA: Ig-like domain-containing protein [Tepidisphaeraceae bacterium]
MATSETLESRVLLAGNVTATFLNGNLIVAGDVAANDITLDQTGLKSHQLRVSGASGTTVNGQAGSVVVSGVKGDVSIRMALGADNVTVRDAQFPQNLGFSQGGRDVLTIDNVAVARDLGFRNSSSVLPVNTTITRTTVGKNLGLTTGDGGQLISLEAVEVTGATVIRTAKRYDVLTINDSTFHGTVNLQTNAGNDRVLIEAGGNPAGPRTRFMAAVSIALDNGDDTLQLGQTAQAGRSSDFLGTTRFNGGAGTDTLSRHNAGFSSKPLIENFENVFPGTDAVAPTVSSTDPAPQATGVALNRKIAATFSEAMASSTIVANFTLKGPGNTPVTGTVSLLGTTATFTPAAPLASNTLFTATISTGAKDVAGNALASNKVWTFTTGAAADTTAPTVSVTDPAGNASGVALNKKIAATFSESMDPLTISAATFTLKAPGNTAVLGTVTYVGLTATFTPNSTLAANTTFTATITTGAKDLAGNALASNKVWTFTTGATPDTTPPTVTLLNPANLKTNVALNKKIATTFSESIDPQTLTTANVTLTGPGNAAVLGTLNYDALTKIATFVPSSNLTANTTYTGRIAGGVNGVKDLAGNPLANDRVWSFTTGTQIAQDPVLLKRAAPFAVMARASISSTGATQINGDVGLNPGAAQGIPTSQVNGTIHVTNQTIINAQTDLLAAYNDAVSRTVTSVALPGNMGGLTFTPGLYTNSTSVLISGAGPNNNVTLDAQGDPNAIFIFKMGSTLTTGPGAQVILAGGAKANNIFWQVGTSATLDTTTIFKGNVMAAVTITVNTGSVVEGRLLGGSTSDGSVTINASTVTVPTA